MIKELGEWIWAFEIIDLLIGCCIGLITIISNLLLISINNLLRNLVLFITFSNINPQKLICLPMSLKLVSCILANSGFELLFEEETELLKELKC